MTVITKIIYYPNQVKGRGDATAAAILNALRARRLKAQKKRRLSASFKVPEPSPHIRQSFMVSFLFSTINCQLCSSGVYIEVLKEIPAGIAKPHELLFQLDNGIPRYLPELFRVFDLDAGDLVVTLADKLV